MYVEYTSSMCIECTDPQYICSIKISWKKGLKWHLRRELMNKRLRNIAVKRCWMWFSVYVSGDSMDWGGWWWSRSYHVQCYSGPSDLLPEEYTALDKECGERRLLFLALLFHTWWTSDAGSWWCIFFYTWGHRFQVSQGLYWKVNPTMRLCITEAQRELEYLCF